MKDGSIVCLPEDHLSYFLHQKSAVSKSTSVLGKQGQRATLLPVGTDGQLIFVPQLSRMLILRGKGEVNSVERVSLGQATGSSNKAAPR